MNCACGFPMFLCQKKCVYVLYSQPEGWSANVWYDKAGRVHKAEAGHLMLRGVAVGKSILCVPPLLFGFGTYVFTLAPLLTFDFS